MRREESKWRRIDGVVPDAPAELRRRYRLDDTAELHDLCDLIRGLGARDAIPDWNSATYIATRDLAHASLTQIQSAAQDIESSIAALHDAIRGFETTFEFSPQIMQEISAVDLAGPENILDLAQLGRLTEFARLFERGHFAIFSELRAIPVKGRPRARVVHRALNRAVAACREFWKNQGRRLAVNTLLETEGGYQWSDLQTEAERFVADALFANGFEPSVGEVGLAWRAASRSDTKRLNRLD